MAVPFNVYRNNVLYHENISWEKKGEKRDFQAFLKRKKNP
jgi:hypothetical protein